MHAGPSADVFLAVLLVLSLRFRGDGVSDSPSLPFSPLLTSFEPHLTSEPTLTFSCYPATSLLRIHTALPAGRLQLQPLRLHTSSTLFYTTLISHTTSTFLFTMRLSSTLSVLSLATTVLVSPPVVHATPLLPISNSDSTIAHIVDKVGDKVSWLCELPLLNRVCQRCGPTGRYSPRVARI